MDSTTTEDHIGKHVTVGDAEGVITDAHQYSYSVSIDLGGVHQHITVTDVFAHGKLE